MKPVGAVLLGAVCACRVGFDPIGGLTSGDSTTGSRDDSSSDRDDGSLDGGPNTPFAGSPRCNWLDGPHFTLAEPISSLDSVPGSKLDAFLSADGLSLYFSTPWRPASADVFRVTRPDEGSTFTDPEVVEWATTPGTDTRLEISFSGLVAVRAADLNQGTGIDLFAATRSSTAEPFGAFQPISELNTDAQEYDPHFADEDGLTLWLAPAPSPNGQPKQDLYVAKKGLPSDPFGALVEMDTLNTTNGESQATLSGDGKVVVFASDRAGNSDLYYSVRTSTASPFPPPMALSDLNSTDDDLEGFVRRDGCEVFFSSDRAESAVHRIYRASFRSP